MEFKFNDKAVIPHLETIASLEIDRHFINKEQIEIIKEFLKHEEIEDVEELSDPKLVNTDTLKFTQSKIKKPLLKLGLIQLYIMIGNNAFLQQFMFMMID